MERLGFQVGTWNVYSLTGRASEVVEALSGKKSRRGMHSRNMMES